MTDIILHPHDHKTVRDWRRILGFLDARLPDDAVRSVLELGGGMGTIAHHYAQRGADAVVCDIDPSYLAVARSRHPRMRAVRHDINLPLPFPSRSFDLVTCTGILHYGHIADCHAVMREIARVSRRHALVDFLSRHSPYRFFEKLYNPAYRPRTHTEREILSFLAPYPFHPAARTSTKSPAFISAVAPFFGKTVYYLLSKE